ncbi:ERI1 exoribonuclease 2 [Thunnus maccoyii]|uniref:ERI1 exoribonuclease 2 n=1 Tax=Thunnus maccoyii TaxID=8240 RepID=UPI001C4CE1A8|nr:ERI1 exoribonuclease 2 [Thunnus maccoyii]
MATKKLAKELGLLRQRSQSSTGLKKAVVSNQIFSYLIVIDFESTCWREKNNYSQEIIEFPAVLLNTSTGEVESEFHTYVQPQERPVLSEFCTELTGITQMQVEAGIPLQICLSRFSRWLQNLQLQMGVVFPNRQQRCSAPSPSQKLCTFLTWSDWDLGVCLQYECKRKQIHKPDVLNSWIDLRSTYRLFYNRKPKGLNGALQDLGIQFSGREHSGVDDARNTAQLAARMMRDGCVMKITRSLDRTPSTVKPMFGNSTCPAHKTENPNTDKEENTSTTNKPSSSKIPVKAGQIKLCTKSNTRLLNTEDTSRSVQESVQSLVSPKTLLNGTTTPLWGRISSISRRSVTAKVVTNISSSVMSICPSPHNNNNNRLLMCSTTIGGLSHPPQQNQTSRTAGLVKDEEGAELIVETEDRCGSYDDVVLVGDDASIETDRELEYVSDVDGRCYVSEEPDNSYSPAGQVTLRETKTQRMETSESSTMSDTTKRVRSHINVSGQFNKMTHSRISEPEAYFAVPKTVTWSSKSNLQKSRAKTPLLRQEKPHVSHENSKINTPSMFRLKPFAPEKTSTPNTSFVRPRATITQHTKTPKSSFSIYTDSAKQAPSSRGSLNFSKNVLSSLSTNTLSSSTNRSFVPVTVRGGGGGKITSPLCACGRRAKRQVVSNGGPNQGRGFYCCAVRRSSSGRIQKGCEFFKWESALMKSSSVASPAVRSSVSLCHINSTLSCRPPQGSSLRKSY